MSLETTFLLMLATVWFSGRVDTFWDLDRLLRDGTAYNPFPGQCGRTVVPLVFVNSRHRLVGGSGTRQGSIPWIGDMMWKRDLWNKEYCAGVIIQDGRMNESDTVLTAADCILRSENKSISFTFGATDLNGHETGRAKATARYTIIHDNFDPGTGPRVLASKTNNIAVVRLDRSIKFTNTIQPICLPIDERLSEGDAGVLAGWSDVKMNLLRSSRILKHQILHVVSSTVCYDWYGNLGHSNGSILCANDPYGRYDVCREDSGSPFFAHHNDRYVLHGILGFSIGSAQWGTPPVYTRIGYFMDWIIRTVHKMHGQRTGSNEDMLVN